MTGKEGRVTVYSHSACSIKYFPPHKGQGDHLSGKMEMSGNLLKLGEMSEKKSCHVKVV